MRFTNEHYDPDKILFFTYDAIADADGIVQKWRQPVKHGSPILAPEREYEGGMVLPVSIYPSLDGDKVVCRYSCINSAKKFPALEEENARNLSCLAESSDGIAWERPSLGLHEFRGSTDNNIAPLPSLEYKMLADPRDVDPERRYKGIALGWPNSGKFPAVNGGKRCFYTSCSPDGLHWGEPQAIPHFVETGDTSGVAYDERQGVFLFCTRPRGYWLSDEVPAFQKRPVKKGMPNGRWIGLATSKDFVEWSELDLILSKDSSDEEGIEFYCFVPFPYGDLYLGFLRRFNGWHGTMDTELVWSTDCRRWHRAQGRTPFIAPGDIGEFDFCFGDAINCKPVRRGDTLYFFYEGRNHVHAPHQVKGNVNEGSMDASMGVATMKIDRFVSLDSGAMGGHLLTEPLAAAGKQLVMNARAAAGGSISLELLDAEAKPLADAPFVFAGDETEQLLRFDGEDALENTPDGTVRLRLTMESAALYSFTIRPG